MISPGELALASIGINAVISDEIPKVGVGRKEEIAKVEEQIPRLARKLVSGDLSHTPMQRPHSYRKLLDVLGGLPRSVDVRSWIEKFNREDQAELGAPFAIAAQAALNDLAAVFPRQSYVTLTGPKVLEPPTTQQWQFFSVLDVVNDPLRVFPLMAVGGLLKRQADMVRMVFPGISSAIDDAIVEAGTGEKLSQIVTYGVLVWQGKRAVEYRPPQNGAPQQAPTKARANAAKRVSSKEAGALSKATPAQKLDASGV